MDRWTDVEQDDDGEKVDAQVDDKEEPIIRLLDNNVEEDEDGETLMHRWSTEHGGDYD